jgi:hypothetical protein
MKTWLPDVVDTLAIMALTFAAVTNTMLILSGLF